jgi:hypothetical protein
MVNKEFYRFYLPPMNYEWEHLNNPNFKPIEFDGFKKRQVSTALF